MKSFWALPALLRVAFASQHVFSVHDDVLAYPQYAVTFSDDYVTELQAQSRVAADEPAVEGRYPDTSDFSDIGEHSSVEDLPQSTNRRKARYNYDVLELQSQRYLCRIPIAEPSAPEDKNNTQERQDEEKELARANDRGWELLRGMQGNCVYYWSGWWSYRYCYGQGVKQFHQLPPSPGVPVYPPTEDPAVPGFVLGKVQEDTGAESKAAAEARGADSEKASTSKSLGELETKGESRYLVQRLEGGTECDLTGKERRIEVQFHCNPGTHDKISLIKETATCAYLMIIQTPRLCNDIAFKPPTKDKPNDISCSPIVRNDQVEAYEASLAAEEQTVADIESAGRRDAREAQLLRQVGGIKLGAHAWIPADQKIEKSAIVGGKNKETLIEVIADSMGKLLSPEQLKKLGLGDPKTIDRLKKELERIAGGKGWKLEVVETPKGKEYRGVIDDEDEKKEAGDKKREEGKEGSEETHKDQDPKRDEL